jgi:hypothetical protein
MPARRSGASAQKSTSQRLCARIPSSQSGKSATEGFPQIKTLVRKNGGTVFGKMISPAIPSLSMSRPRSASSQFLCFLLPMCLRCGFL